MRGNPIKVIMVGDCASVGETLIRYASAGIEYQHLKRTRGLYSKTLGIALSILRSRGSLYHVHYGLQDHLFTRLLKRGTPTVCHLHGSDLRYTIKSPYGWIVRRNLKDADRVIVAVPDILETARSYRADAQYVPNPVDFALFRAAPMRRHGEGLRVLFASALSIVKGAHHFVSQYARYQRVNPDSTLYVIRYGKDQSKIMALLAKLAVKFRLLEPVPHNEMPALYRSSDVVVTDLRLGYLHMTSLEAMACHRPVVQYINDRLYARLRIPLPPVVKLVMGDSLNEKLEKLADESARVKTCVEQEQYLQRHHNPVEISRKIAEAYHEVIRDKQTREK